MVNIQISLTGANGDTIELNNEDYVLQTGVRGFGIPNAVLRIDKSAGNGGVYRFSKRDIRELDLPIVVLSNGGNLEEKLRRLANVLKSAVTITASYDDGDAYELVAYYNGGAETQFGSNASNDFAVWALTMQAPQPFWTSKSPKQFSVSASSGTKGLLAAPSGVSSLSRLLVKTDQALGLVNVENIGDVEAPIVWQIKGPSTNVAITLNGVGFEYTETITSSDTITIDSEKGTVVNQSGVNKYSYLSTAPKLFSVPSGNSVISITATGADSNTKISGFFKPRREVIH
jgi:phage-related protein